MNINPGARNTSMRNDAKQKLIVVGHSTTPFISIYKFDRLNRTLTKLANPTTLPFNTLYSVKFSNNKRYLAAGDSFGVLTIYNTTDWSVVLQQDLGVGTVFDIDWSPDDSELVVNFGGSVFDFRFYNTSDWSSTNFIVNVDYPGYDKSISYSPDGTTFVVAFTFAFRYIIVYDTTIRNLILAKTGSNGGFYSGKYSKTGDYIGVTQLSGSSQPGLLTTSSLSDVPLINQTISYVSRGSGDAKNYARFSDDKRYFALTGYATPPTTNINIFGMSDLTRVGNAPTASLNSGRIFDTIFNKNNDIFISKDVVPYVDVVTVNNWSITTGSFIGNIPPATCNTIDCNF